MNAEAPPPLLNLSKDDYKWLAFAISKEAGPGDDHLYVAASIINRVISPNYPSTVKDVIFAAGQYQAVYENKAYHMPERAAYYASMEGNMALYRTGQTLKGRENFKGQSELANRGTTDGVPDPIAHPKGNFFHYGYQEGGGTRPANYKPPNWDKVTNPLYIKARDDFMSGNWFK